MLKKACFAMVIMAYSVNPDCCSLKYKVSEDQCRLLEDIAVGLAAGFVPGIGQCEVLLQAAAAIMNKRDDRLPALWLSHALGFSTYIYIIASLSGRKGAFAGAVAGTAMPLLAYPVIKKFSILKKLHDYRDQNSLVTSLHKLKQYLQPRT